LEADSFRLLKGDSAMSATLVVRHKVNDYAAWRNVYDELEPLRAQHGCTAKRVMQLPDDATDLLITHDFPSVEQASSFAHDPELKAGMLRAGVDGPPQIEIFAVV
jgi:hypothetical protein